ncbi:hypothetical protein [Streptomyces sp. NBC_01571]|uniref:hypothetical protein n=1 Tax=unclassified Streptomyces TaxID=2593676 RepID=UPI002255890A|nr:hypothetical protein [Streptomyces sp. NBC_01571]MCX4580169.1 hypothetical protein [Streptomyces sp. NBC_01571]
MQITVHGGPGSHDRGRHFHELGDGSGHVRLADGGAGAVGAAGTARTAISDHRPLVVELSL